LSLAIPHLSVGRHTGLPRTLRVRRLRWTFIHGTLTSCLAGGQEPVHDPTRENSLWLCAPMFLGSSNCSSLATPSRNPPHTTGFTATMRSLPQTHIVPGARGVLGRRSFNMSWNKLAQDFQLAYFFVNHNEPLGRGQVNYLGLFAAYWPSARGGAGSHQATFSFRSLTAWWHRTTWNQCPPRHVFSSPCSGRSPESSCNVTPG
jgi:hypothetical protein